MLGPGCVLVHCTPNGFRATERDAASTVQKCLVGAQHEPDWLFHRCQRIADLLDKGELALAQIYGLQIPIGDLDDLQLKQLARVHLAKAGFNPDEPRIPKGDHGGGEWTDGEGAAASASTSSNSDPRAGLPVLESISPAPAPDLRALFGSNDVGANAVWNIVPVADFSGGFHDAVVDV